MSHGDVAVSASVAALDADHDILGFCICGRPCYLSPLASAADPHRPPYDPSTLPIPDPVTLS